MFVLPGTMVVLGQGGIATRPRPRSNGSLGQSCTKLYVGNLASDVTEDDLKIFFAGFNILPSSILKIVLKRGFAFVEFRDQSVADMAIEKCDEKPFMNTIIRLEPAMRTEGRVVDVIGKDIVQVLISNCKL